jgi:hypothetical protein
MNRAFRRCCHRVGVVLAVVVMPGAAVAQSSGAPGARPFVIEIVPGHSLESDGRGSYRDGDAGVGAFGLNAITLCSDGRRCSTLPEASANTTTRTVILDLQRPAPNSGAIPRGRITPTKANFGAFWELDTARRAINNGVEGWAIRRALDIPVGSTVVSQRVEIRFFVAGLQYILQFGQWTAGQFQTNQGLLSGAGSTPATIARTSDSTWIVRSGDRSLGRLWDNHDPAHPADLGLYEFSFDVRYRALPKRDVPPPGSSPVLHNDR